MKIDHTETAAGCGTCCSAVSSSADMVLYRGQVATVDEDFAIVEGVAVTDGKIIAVGTNREIEAYIGKNTEIIDLHGRTMLPGINDSHGHLTSWAIGRPPLTLDVSGAAAQSIADVQTVVAAKIATAKPGEWIRGFGWSLEGLGVDDYCSLTKECLDEVSPNNPVILTEFSYHTVWVNSKALEMAGVTRTTPNQDGFIVVNECGNPAGLLKESAASSFAAIIPPFSDLDIKDATVVAMKELNALGITSITDPLVTEKEWNLYQDIKKDGNLSVRVNMLSGSPADAFATSVEELKGSVEWLKTLAPDDTSMLKIAGFKLFADGIPPTMTAWMREPYVGTNQRGSLVTAGATDEEKCASLHELIDYANSQGYQIGVHAVGERAIDATVAGFLSALDRHRWDARHYIIHGDFISRDTAKLTSEHGIGVATQPTIKWSFASHLHFVVSEELVAYGCPLRTLFDAGVCVTSSSDLPIVYPDWKRGVQSAVLRDGNGTDACFGPEQRITLEEAIRSYTINAAYQDHMDQVKGSIQVGKVADFCVLAEDIFDIAPQKIADIDIDLTILNGKIVYQR